MATLKAEIARMNGNSTDSLAKNFRRSLAKGVGLVRPYLYESWPPALNGQRFRQSLFRSLIQQLLPQAIFESGTYCGGTTQFLWHVSGRRVYTAEKNPAFATRSARRFANTPEVQVISGDSRKALVNLRDNGSFPRSHVLFYLDAHWEADLPLREEVEIVTQTWTRSVIVIDDFKVPDDPGYGFDTYGTSQLSMEYLGDAVKPYEVFWPNCPSSEETGARRGCVVLASPDTAAWVATIQQVRRISGPDLTGLAGSTPIGSP